LPEIGCHNNAALDYFFSLNRLCFPAMPEEGQAAQAEQI